VDDSRFVDPDDSATRQAQEWRRSLGISDNETVFLFAGKLEPIKAPELLIDQFVGQERKDQHLIIAGSGPLEGRLRAKAGDRRNIHFLGFQNQSAMPTVYRLGDVYVLPSRGETWGLAVNEAMICGLPVITSDKVGCAVDLVMPGETGYVFRNNEPETLANAIATIGASSELRRGLGENARRLIRKWSLLEQTEHIENAILARVPSGQHHRR
jgi:glycosyltransferase involved in cell wall biosynthesis